MGEGRGIDWWVYWGATAMFAAFVGGLALPWLLKNDPLNLREMAS